MGKEEFLESLELIKDQIDNLIDTYKNQENISEDKKEKSTIRNQNDVYSKNTILKYFRENHNVLNKELQQELFKKISYCNYRKIGLIKLMRELNIEFSYVDTDSEWKDIELR